LRHSNFLESINADWLDQAGLRLSVLRLDLAYPQLSGNKYFKLKYNLLAARQQACTRLLSFGGVFSNHIHALAIAGQRQGFATLGIIRGERGVALTPTLQDAVKNGMQLQFVDRQTYRRRYDADYLQALQRQYPDAYMIPEGGNNTLGAKGCSEILQGLDEDVDCVMLPCGTANTLAGIASNLADNAQLVGVAVLKAADALRENTRHLLQELACQDKDNWSIEERFHCGGYAKLNKSLAEFVSRFSAEHFSIEPVYSGKLFWAIYQKALAGEFKKGSHILAIHTGGMQGLRGMQGRIEQLLVS
jgi:1-aminocyclopropane-1-carboxylate deaminase